MSSKLTYEYVKDCFLNEGFYLISNSYNGNREKLKIEDREGYKYEITFDCFIIGLKRNSEYARFYQRNPYTEENIRLWLKLNNVNFHLIEGQNFNNNNEKLYWKCLNCYEDEEFIYLAWAQIQERKSCPICSRKRTGKHNNLEILRPDVAKNWDYEKNEFPPSFYTAHSEQKVWWKCEKCNKSSFCRISDRVDKNSDCPRCNFSKGERKISDFLDANNIEFDPQHSFSGCINKKELFFDFYIYGFDCEICIEYDGELHYEIHRWSNKKDAIQKLKKQQTNDKIKTKYCKENNIYLLRIPYWDFNNIEQILTETLFS